MSYRNFAGNSLKSLLRSMEMGYFESESVLKALEEQRAVSVTDFESVRNTLRDAKAAERWYWRVASKPNYKRNKFLLSFGVGLAFALLALWGFGANGHRLNLLEGGFVGGMAFLLWFAGIWFFFPHNRTARLFEDFNPLEIKSHMEDVRNLARETPLLEICEVPLEKFNAASVPSQVNYVVRKLKEASSKKLQFRVVYLAVVEWAAGNGSKEIRSLCANPKLVVSTADGEEKFVLASWDPQNTHFPDKGRENEEFSAAGPYRHVLAEAEQPA